MRLAWQRFWREAWADRRTMALAVVLLSFTMLLWGRLLLKNVPQTATADPEHAADVATGYDDAPPPQEAVVTDPSPYNRPDFAGFPHGPGKSSHDDADKPSR